MRVKVSLGIPPVVAYMVLGSLSQFMSAAKAAFIAGISYRAQTGDLNTIRS